MITGCIDLKTRIAYRHVLQMLARYSHQFGIGNAYYFFKICKLSAVRNLVLPIAAQLQMLVAARQCGRGECQRLRVVLGKHVYPYMTMLVQDLGFSVLLLALNGFIVAVCLPHIAGQQNRCVNLTKLQKITMLNFVLSKTATSFS